jgi:hypothetical protein
VVAVISAAIGLYYGGTQAVARATGEAVQSRAAETATEEAVRRLLQDAQDETREDS